MMGLDREWCCVVNLDTKMRPVNFNVVSVGALNHSIVPVQNVLKSAILSNCETILLLHNHPSGMPTPSKQDRNITKRVAEACNLLDMELIDHIIIGSQTGTMYSFHEEEPELLKIGDTDFDYIHNIVSIRESTIHYGSKTYDPKQAIVQRKEELKSITEKLEQGVLAVFNSDRYRKFLDTMARFPQYSLNNNLLILMQKPDATLCQSYTGWQKMGRFVKKGEKGIRILAPAPFKAHKEHDKLDEHGHILLDADGKPQKEAEEVRITSFKPVSTFDISQTDGEPLPTIGIDEFHGKVADYQIMFTAIQHASPVSIRFQDITSGAKGYYDRSANEIALNTGMDEIQNVKTLIHELSHAQLHNREVQKARADGEQSRSSKEVEAESIAYTVCQHYGIDTSDYSFAYVASWSQGKELPELRESLTTIRDTASDLITTIDANVETLKSHEQSPEHVNTRMEGNPMINHASVNMQNYLKDADQKERLAIEDTDKKDLTDEKESVLKKLHTTKQSITKTQRSAKPRIKKDALCPDRNLC